MAERDSVNQNAGKSGPPAWTNTHYAFKPNWNKPFVLRDGFPPKPIQGGVIYPSYNAAEVSSIPKDYENKKFVSGNKCNLVPIGDKKFIREESRWDRHRLPSVSKTSEERYVHWSKLRR